MSELTKPQQKVYDFIVNYVSANGLPPTLREIMEGCSYKSTCPVSEALKRIEKAGLVKLSKTGSYRGLKLTQYKLVLVPIEEAN